MRWMALTSIGALLLVTTVLHPRTTRGCELSAEDEQRFVDLAQAGKQAYDEGNFELAASLFVNALDICEDTRVVLYLGHSYRNLDRYDDAIRTYRRYLDLDPDAPDRGKIERYIAEMEEKSRALVPTVSIETEPPGAAVHLDALDTPVLGMTPHTAQIPAGAHQIFVVLDGFETHRFDVELDPGDDETLKATLVPIPVVVEIPPDDEPPIDPEVVVIQIPEADDDTNRIAGWVLLGSGAVLAGVGVVFQVDATDLTSQAGDCYDARHSGCTREQDDDLRDRANDSQIVAVVMFACGGVALGTGLVFLLAEWLVGEDTLEEPGGQSVGWVPVVGPDGFGVRFEVPF